MYSGPSWEGGIKPEKPAPPKPAVPPKPMAAPAAGAPTSPTPDASVTTPNAQPAVAAVTNRLLLHPQFQDRFISNANRVVLLNYFHAPIVSVNRRGRPRHVRGFDGWPRGELTAANTVGHIHHDADDGPHDEPHPGYPWEETHEAEAGQHPKNGDDRHEWHRNGRSWLGFV